MHVVSQLANGIVRSRIQQLQISASGSRKMEDGSSSNAPSLGSVNVVLCGNQHQFPPVETAASEALYHLLNLARDSVDAQIGRTICEEFEIVVILKEQMRLITFLERYTLALHLGKKKTRKNLPDRVGMVIGVKVLVTRNIETDLDITNGARGEIVDVILDPREPEPPEAAEVVELKNVPVYILVKMSRTRAERLEGLEENVIPIEPTSQTMRLTLRQGKKTVMRTAKQSQFSMAPAYAFTNYRSQGQTLPYISKSQQGN
ncbi:hypothetical protein D9757_000682 [Collybiopsis confluens]|uniref:Uncharacterized protein n=1 Tax=Collybiopsis confluens TaxID=2823264 RepID=A0A8H5MGM9_9AGAR|nr:hypothetical protein D9757_000682 [Collybiopsis confluens]